MQVLELIMIKCGEWGFDTVWDGHYWMTDFETVRLEKPFSDGGEGLPNADVLLI